jgi:hypothetical protein
VTGPRTSASSVEEKTVYEVRELVAGIGFTEGPL